MRTVKKMEVPIEEMRVTFCKTTLYIKKTVGVEKSWISVFAKSSPAVKYPRIQDNETTATQKKILDLELDSNALVHIALYLRKP